MQKISKKPSLAEMTLQHFIVFLICIVFPGLVTSIASATWLTFERSKETVRCTARTCVYFIVPFKVQVIEEVTQIGFRERAARTERQRKFGRTTNETVHVDGEGFLQIQGADDKLVEVSVSPASIEEVVDRANEFLHSSDTDSATFFTIANWKFGAIMGGVLTSFTAIYVVGYSLELVRLLYVSTIRLSGLRPNSLVKNGES